MANTTASRLDRITSILVPPDVFLGKRQMTEFEELRNKFRHCHTCGRPMKWGEFLRSAHVSGNRTKFGMEMLKEIWENDIFVINCCSCHSHYQRENNRNDAIDALCMGVAYFEHDPYE